MSLGFEILAFPCNQFGGQEPESNPDIKRFVCTRFKAEFPIFDKVLIQEQKHSRWVFIGCTFCRWVRAWILISCFFRLMSMDRAQLLSTSSWNQSLVDSWVISSNGTLRNSWLTKRAELSKDTLPRLRLSKSRYRIKLCSLYISVQCFRFVSWTERVGLFDCIQRIYQSIKLITPRLYIYIYVRWYGFVVLLLTIFLYWDVAEGHPQIACRLNLLVTNRQVSTQTSPLNVGTVYQRFR